MIEFDTIIFQFAENGEKTGWSYIDVPLDIAEQLKPGTKKTYRVKGKLDHYSFRGLSLTPVGQGNYILALNAEIRKAIRKSKGAMVHVYLEADDEFSIEPPDYLIECLREEEGAYEQFFSLAKSHRDYFVKWIESAKGEETKAKRLMLTVRAMKYKLSYGEMIREQKGRNAH